MKLSLRKIGEEFQKLKNGFYGNKMPRRVKRLLSRAKKDAKALGLDERVKEITALENEWAAQVREYEQSKLSPIDSQLGQLNKIAQNLDLKLAEPFEEKLNIVAASLLAAKNAKELQIKKKYENNDEKLQNKTHEKKEAILALDDAKGLLRFLPARATLLDSKGALIGSVIVTGVLEAAFSFEAMDNLGIPWGSISMLAGLAFSGLIGLGCHFFGQALARRNYLYAGISSMASTSVLGLLILLRHHSAGLIDVPNDGVIYTSLHQNEDGIMNKNGLLAIANTITLVFGMLLGERVNRYRYYFNSKETLKKAGEDIDTLNHQNFLKDTQMSMNGEEHTALAYQIAHQQDAESRSRLLGVKQQIAELEAKRSGLVKRFKEWELMGHAALKASFNAATSYRKLL